MTLQEWEMGTDAYESQIAADAAGTDPEKKMPRASQNEIETDASGNGLQPVPALDQKDQGK